MGDVGIDELRAQGEGPAFRHTRCQRACDNDFEASAGDVELPDVYGGEIEIGTHGGEGALEEALLGREGDGQQHLVGNLAGHRAKQRIFGGMEHHLLDGSTCCRRDPLLDIDTDAVRLVSFYAHGVWLTTAQAQRPAERTLNARGISGCPQRT